MKSKDFADRKSITMPRIYELSDKIFELRHGGELILMHQGEIKFDTPEQIKKAAVDALQKGYTHYAPSKGYQELREAVAENLREEVDLDPNTEILITQSGIEGLFCALHSVLTPGEKILTFDPFYFPIEPLVKMAGGELVYIQTREDEGWRASPEEIEKYITPSTKGLFINSPNNPTGEVYERSYLESIAEVAKKYNLLIISDEAYKDLVYDGLKHHSIISFPDMKERVLSVFTFSKSYAMTGWRLGYIVGSRKLIERAHTIHSSLVAHVTSFIQIAGVTALRESKEFLLEMRRELDERRKLLVEGLNKIPGIRCRTPKGATYAFPRIKELGMSSEEFSDFLLEKAGIAVYPGNAFGKCGEGHVRFSYSQSSKEEIMLALERLKKVLA